MRPRRQNEQVPDGPPLLSQLNLPVGDMEASLGFYRGLGLSVDAEPGAEHVAIRFPGGMLLELDSAGFVRQWDSGYAGSRGGSAVIGFAVASREAVDTTYQALLGAGGRPRQRPYDAFWGARYAIVDDPDGNPVGLMSPIDRSRASWPPAAPPG